MLAAQPWVCTPCCEVPHVTQEQDRNAGSQVHVTQEQDRNAGSQVHPRTEKSELAFQGHIQVWEALLCSPWTGVVCLASRPPVLPSLFPELLSCPWQVDPVQECFPTGLPISGPHPAWQIASDLGHLVVYHLSTFKPVSTWEMVSIRDSHHPSSSVPRGAGENSHEVRAAPAPCGRSFW